MKKNFLLLASIAFAATIPTVYAKTEKTASDENIYQMPASEIRTRWYTFENRNGEKGGGGKANFGRKGAPSTPIAAGDTLVLADIHESGTIRRIWMTLYKFDQEALRGFKIEIYWDGAKTPAVQAPLGDFFCMAMGKPVAFDNALFSSPEAKSMNCIAPMPFKKSAKILLINDSDRDNGTYYEVDTTLGDVHDDNMLYFHSYWRRENPTVLRKDYTILPKIEGKGRFIGCNIGVKSDYRCTNFWWGEGEMKIYLDDDNDYPTLCGTGAEDYIGAGYGMGLFSFPYFGNNFVSENKDAYGFYRLHIPDPVYFYKNIRATIQVMGGPGYPAMLESMNKYPELKFMKAGDGTQYYTKEELEAHPEWSNVMERTDDYCSTAYWYMDKPENNLPPIQGINDRLTDLP